LPTCLLTSMSLPLWPTSHPTFPCPVPFLAPLSVLSCYLLVPLRLPCLPPRGSTASSMSPPMLCGGCRRPTCTLSPSSSAPAPWRMCCEYGPRGLPFAPYICMVLGLSRPLH
jgi:hypothetical protein